jgi:site-specific DNA-methyltransferase (adenine-specific)
VANAGSFAHQRRLLTVQHEIVFGDCRNMSAIADGSVQLIITSPPYWQLKDYGAAGQIGYHDAYEEYIAGLNAVWAQCNRVLSPGCRLCINVGDQFARAAHYGRYKVIPIREEIVRACEALGLDYMGAVIWQKLTTMNTSGGGAVMGSYPYPRNGILKIDYEFILLFKKLGTPPAVSSEVKEASALTREEWNQYFSGHWNFPGERQGKGHIATFPLELPRRLIKMFSFVGETVLDPFAGSGSTVRAAMDLGRRGLGYEINSAYESAIRDRLGLAMGDLFSTDEVVFRHAAAAPVMPVTAAPSPGALQRTASAKKNSFGSVVAAADGARPRERGLKVIRVLDGLRLELEGGKTVRLSGVLPNGNSAEAKVYLEKMAAGKRVFIKAGQSEPDGCASARVYLANRTCLNSKLVKLGLAVKSE